LLNKKDETLERMEELFLTKFKDSQGVFRASYALANLLTLNAYLGLYSSSLACSEFQPFSS
jgi:hypothetical protein